KALALLDGFKYQWRDVLSRMLAVNPQDRPLPLSDLPRQLQPIESPEDLVPTKLKRPASWAGFWKRWYFILATAIVIVALAIATVAFFWHKTNGLLPPSQDDFNELFSSSDVFLPEEVGK
ncbi:MAG: hypothetical protein IJC66_10435, partial [Kiritimatiellae bacterium]|nr:hypothetical protein [Kiritimatiellia bacterium]